MKIPWYSFGPIVDGYCIPSDTRSIYASGKQAHVPLLAGWNRDEGSYQSFFDQNEPATIENYVERARSRFGGDADTFLRLYPASTETEMKRSAQDFAGDEFIAFATWKWIDLQHETAKSPVFRYEFDETLPLPADAKPGDEPRAPHASDIEFVFQVLSSKDLPWRPDDYAVSDLMSSYWTNFAKTGDPNGPGLPHWPEYSDKSGYPVMHLNAKSAATPDVHRERYKFLDRLYSTP